MNFVRDDGGRAEAGFKGKCGDCVVRAIAIAAELPYAEVYGAMAQINNGVHRRRGKPKGKSARSGVLVKSAGFRRFMDDLGWEFVPTMGIGTGCKVHLDARELPAGRLIVSVSKHYTTVIDHVIHDTFDPQERPVMIYPPGTPTSELPAKARFLGPGQGWAYEPQRCVYGYWKKKS
jgi:hypothetical protein